MIQLQNLTISKLQQGYRNGDYSVTEITKKYLDRIQKINPKLNAYLTVTSDYALKKAKELDKQINKKTNKQKNKIIQNSPLFGVPIGLKDLYLTKGIRTTAGSKVLENYIPQYSCTAWKKLESAGAILLGKLNCDAWAHGSSGENSDYGPTKNPWNINKVAGGSSSGSAAALSANLCLISSGSDTCGSIRLPASFNNLVGLKPTYGRVSRYGIVAMSSSLDSIGHLTKTVWDNAYYLETSAGRDSLDATTPDIKVPAYTKHLNNSLNKIKKLKIGIPKEYFGQGLNSEVKNKVTNAIKQLEKHGANIQEISLPYTNYGLATYYIIQPSEVSSNLGRYDGIRYGNNRNAFGNEAKRRIMIGTYSLSSGYYDAYYKKAMQVRTLIIKDFQKTFQKIDIIIAPVAPTPAFKLGAKQSGIEMYLTDIYAAPSSLAGIPSLALPCGFTKTNLPIGMQIMGPQFSEQLLFQVGHAYQQITKWHTKSPNL